MININELSITAPSEHQSLDWNNIGNLVGERLSSAFPEFKESKHIPQVNFQLQNTNLNDASQIADQIVEQIIHQLTIK